MSLPSSNWAAQAFRGAFQKTFLIAPQPGKIQTRRRRSRRPGQQISLESLEPRQMLSVNPATSGSSASSSTDTSSITAFVSQNTIGILSVPSAPTSVVAVRGNASLAVTWTAPASNGGSAITDYLVKYSSNNGSTWTNFPHPVSTVPSLTVTGLANGTEYVIKVIARNADGISLPSANSFPVTPALLAMSRVTVGNPGNFADAGIINPGFGAVSYSYQIGTYDVTGSQYTAFLNAVGSTDTYALYNASMGTDTTVAQISRSGTAGTYTYAVMNSTGQRPISYVSWWDSARFSNWMSNGQPNGAQVSTTTENGTYNVNGATSGNAVARNVTNPNTSLPPTYRIPLENEWYKAAYYKGGSTNAGYWTYATQSNTYPGIKIGGIANQANYAKNIVEVIGHATNVGSFSGSESFYGTFDQSGNVYQWNDLDGTAGLYRGLRGGSWNKDGNFMWSSSRDENAALSVENNIIGFRLASPVTTTLTPAFWGTTSTAHGFTVQISNYDSSYSWAGTATASGSVVVSGTGLVTVTGVAAGTSSTATITTTKSNTVGGSAPVTATSQGALAIDMSMVTVSNPGNAADANTGMVYGAVAYSYQIGKYDVTGLQYTAFLNAVGSTDTYGLYNVFMGTNTNVAQISRSGTAGTYTYAVMNSTGQRPISYVSWFDSARFSNWMSNGQPSGAQVSTTTENGAYNVNGATSGNAVAANTNNPNTNMAPTYQIPLENEWHKAAYYSPNYGGSGVGGYYAFATQSNVAPGTTVGSSANQANYKSAIGHATAVGKFTGSGSYYGTFDQTGNVWQWNDLDGTAGLLRGGKGGSWESSSSNAVSSQSGFQTIPSSEDNLTGFRLAMRPPVPGSPTSVAAVSGNASLAVTWTAPASTGGSPITDYQVKYSSNNGSTWTNVFHQASIVPSLTVTGLTNGTAYVIKVIAKNAVGISLPSANSAPATPALLAMSRVTVGNPGNLADTSTGSLYGAVSYSYRIGTYDVTGSQYAVFLNAVGSTDTYGLYSTSMGTNTTVAQISRSGTPGTYTYAVMNSTGQRPISYVSWFDSARFSNWMSNGQPSGAQVSTTTENGAYNVNGATSGNAVARNVTNPNTGSVPTFRMPLENEWYKAAYYVQGAIFSSYYSYATRSSTAPGTTIGSSANQANYNNAFGHSTDVGSFSGSGSFYGTFDQSGNVSQWNDLDGTAGSSRGLRGGDWGYFGPTDVSSSFRYDDYDLGGEANVIGFRLASPV